MKRNKKVDEKKTLSYNVGFNFEYGTTFLMDKKIYVFIKMFHDYYPNGDRITLICCKLIKEKSKYVVINVSENRNKEVEILQFDSTQL